MSEKRKVKKKPSVREKFLDWIVSRPKWSWCFLGMGALIIFILILALFPLWVPPMLGYAFYEKIVDEINMNSGW